LSKIPFVGPAYSARSLNADAQRAVNCYLEMDNASPRAPVALYGTPGLDLMQTLGSAPVRGQIKLGSGTMIVVAGSTVYAVSLSGALTTLGTINSVAGLVGMAANTTQVLIVDGLGGWLATATSLTEVVDEDFPAGVTWAKYISSYFVVGGDGSSQFYWNETPNDGSAWNGLDFASAEGNPDIIVGGESNQLELWLFGTASAEIFILTGDPDAPFQRQGNTFIESGAVSKDCIAKIDSTVFWIGQDDRGAGIVWRAQGYSPARISNHALEKALQSSTLSDAFAFAYQQEGHGFYVLTLPTAGTTWVYDVSTNEWHERQSYSDFSLAALTRWRPQTYCFFANQHWVGDYATGKLYTLNLDSNTEDGTPILRLRATQCMDSPGGERMFYQALQIDMETGLGDGAGSDPQLMLRYSNDGGHTWSNVKTASAGKAGEYGRRVKFGPSGAGRNRVWEISMTDDAKFAVFGAYLRAQAGAS
jgi:hypothetical protein